MKLGIAFVLLTCALLFPQTGQTPAQIRATCVAKCKSNYSACIKAAKTETAKTICGRQQAACVEGCK